MPGQFIALEGTDGIGKTSLAMELADLGYDDAVAKLAEHEGEFPSGADDGALTFVSRRQISKTSNDAALLMQQVSTLLWHSGDTPDLSDAFWVPLQAAWFTAHTEAVLEPLLRAGFDVVVDGWIYKFFAKLLIQGFSETDLAVIFSRVRMPDQVLLLNGDIETIFDRRTDFRPAELGLYGGYSHLGRDTFVDYQTRTARNLQIFADRYGWTSIEVARDEELQATALRLAPVLNRLRSPACP